MTEEKKVGFEVEVEQPQSLRTAIILILEKSRDESASITKIVAETKVKKNVLRQCISREKKKATPRFRRSGQHGLRLCSGLALAHDLDWDTIKLEPVKHTFLFPKPLRGILGPEEGINSLVFFMVAAGPDEYKTALLVDLAIEAARSGQRVLFLNHEADDRRAVRLFAMRIAKKNFRNDPAGDAEAVEVCKKSEIIRRIKVRSCAEQQIEELDLRDFDLLAWDYLSSSFLRADHLARQGSHYSKFVQLLGQTVVDKGIPLVCATQKHWGEGGLKSTWFERATSALIVEDIERAGPDEVLDHLVYRIVKNKEEGCHAFIDVWYSYITGIERAEPLSKVAWAARVQARKELRKKIRK